LFNKAVRGCPFAASANASTLSRSRAACEASRVSGRSRLEPPAEARRLEPRAEQ
jgi:hypothetical protein